MINSINWHPAGLYTNLYKSNYPQAKIERINREAENDNNQDDDSVLDTSSNQNSTLSPLINKLISGLGEKYEKLTSNITGSKNNNSSSGSNNANNTNNTNNNSGSNTTELTEDQKKNRADAQELITKLLGDQSIAKKYNNLMAQISGGSSTSGNTAAAKLTALSTTQDKEKLSNFISNQQSLISKSLFVDIVNKKNEKETGTTTQTQPTTSETSTNFFSTAQIKNLVAKNKI